MAKMKPCRLCGKHAIIETWSSGGLMYMAKCSNPDCFEYYPRGHSLPQVIAEWNQMQDGGKYDADAPERDGKDGRDG